jgi:hypothetical protein
MAAKVNKFFYIANKMLKKLLQIFFLFFYAFIYC